MAQDPRIQQENEMVPPVESVLEEKVKAVVPIDSDRIHVFKDRVRMAFEDPCFEVVCEHFGIHSVPLKKHSSGISYLQLSDAMGRVPLHRMTEEAIQEVLKIRTELIKEGYFSDAASMAGVDIIPNYVDGERGEEEKEEEEKEVDIFNPRDEL